MFGAKVLVAAVLDVIIQLINIPLTILSTIEKIRLNIVAAAIAIWTQIKDSRAMTITLKVERSRVEDWSKDRVSSQPESQSPPSPASDQATTEQYTPTKPHQGQDSSSEY